MKKVILLPLFLILVQVNAQERIILNGQVVKEDFLLENVHVQNVTTGLYAITDKTGLFKLSSRAGDTLLLSHVDARDLVRILDEDDFSTFPLVIRFTDTHHELEEIIIDERDKISAVSVGIIQKKTRKLTMNERRLKTAGDFKPIHLLSILGGSLQIDSILNAINGRTKKLKRNTRIENKLKDIAYLEGFSDYMQKEMLLTEEQISRLIAYAVEEENLRRIIDSQNDAAVHFFLQDMWIKLQEEHP